VRFLALLVSFALVQGPLALPPTQAQFLSLFGGYIDALRVQAGIPGMAGAIVSDTDVLWQQPFGLRDPGASDPMLSDTPFQFDGLTQTITATMVMQCIDQGRITFDSRIGSFTPSSADANATVGQILSHTSDTSGGLAFTYNTDRLESLKFVVETCTGNTFRTAFRNTLERLGMMDSMPGPDAASSDLTNADVAPPATADKYTQLLNRLARPFSVSATGVPTASDYNVRTLRAADGLISTVFDFAKFDLALRQDKLGISAATRARAWSNPVSTSGQLLPHGMGWFVQSYNGEPVVWQFGVEANASSSLLITLPARNVTLILLANSDGLAKPASLSAGDITVSPFAKVFLGLVVK
jgi:CubicO group peptidase (beta-lactamase class C family)